MKYLSTTATVILLCCLFFFIKTVRLAWRVKIFVRVSVGQTLLIPIEVTLNYGNRFGTLGGIRTHDHCIKSAILCQLSYGRMCRSDYR